MINCDARLGSPLEGARRRGCETLGASGAAEWAWRVNKEPLKVLAHSFKSVLNLNSYTSQMCWTTNARKLQNLRAANGASTE